MKHLQKYFLIVVVALLVSLSASCGKKHTVKFISNGELVEELEVKKGETVEEKEISNEGYKFLGWYLGEELYDFSTEISSDIVLIAKWDEIVLKAKFEINGTLSLYENATTKLSVQLTTEGETPTFDWGIEDENIVDFDSKKKNNVTLFGVNVGTTKVILTGTYSDGSTEIIEVEVTVLGQEFSLTYELNNNDIELMPSDAPSAYNTGELPFTLPVLSRDYYIFQGWLIEGFDGVYKEINASDEIEGNLILSPKWLYPHMELNFENDSVTVEENETIQLNVKTFDIELDYVLNVFTFKSLNENVATIDSNGLVSAVSKGYAEILVSVTEKPEINTSIGITVVEDYASMNEVLEYLVSIAGTNNTVKNITVTGWQRVYTHELRTSVIGYLFEDLVITENIAPLGNGVRPGTVYEKKYICVHDTGDVDYSAKDWSNTVYNNYNELTGKSYGASYQYVIDNQDCYHNIPDNERSYHAGDGNRTYEEVASGVYGTEKYPTITITTDGYYAINGTKSTILAPTYNGQILKTSDINDYGIRCVIRDGQYYLGKTWYDTTYRKIGNYGGNNNSIGIESCVTEGDDIYYTWQRLAKLVAKLMDENNLTIDDVVTHHYFSGKNCPQTMREAGFYLHFKKLVQIEYQMLQFIKQGYTISFESGNTEYVNESGRVIKTSPLSKTVPYTITVEKDGVKDSITLSSVIQYTPYL